MAKFYGVYQTKETSTEDYLFEGLFKTKREAKKWLENYELPSNAGRGNNLYISEASLADIDRAGY